MPHRLKHRSGAFLARTRRMPHSIRREPMHLRLHTHPKDNGQKPRTQSGYHTAVTFRVGNTPRHNRNDHSPPRHSPTARLLPPLHHRRRPPRHSTKPHPQGLIRRQPAQQALGLLSLADTPPEKTDWTAPISARPNPLFVPIVCLLFIQRDPRHNTLFCPWDKYR